MIRALDL